MDDEHKEEFYDHMADDQKPVLQCSWDDTRLVVERLYENGYFIAHADDEEVGFWQRLIRRFWR